MEENRIKVYKVSDDEDKGFKEFYATPEEIESYLDDQQDNIPDYDEDDSWTDNLERYGLNYELVWTNDK